MKHDTRQFLSIVQARASELNLDQANTYRYAIDDASKILKTVSSREFEVYAVWIYIGKLFLYALIEAKNQKSSLRDIHFELLSLRSGINDEYSIEAAKFELEAFICDTIFKSSVQIDQLFSCFRMLGITINQIKAFSLSILAVNRENHESQYLKDTLALALFDEYEGRPIKIGNVNEYLIKVHAHIKREKVKLYYDHYELL
ncbi:hypothetical protein [Alteromonas macleodii]|uniref:hypothetical protein n=1 Tax=Alteromonas macleodii TaxID=28108 RepID=UPI003140C905